MRHTNGKALFRDPDNENDKKRKLIVTWKKKVKNIDPETGEERKENSKDKKYSSS